MSKQKCIYEAWLEHSLNDTLTAAGGHIIVCYDARGGGIESDGLRVR